MVRKIFRWFIFTVAAVLAAAVAINLWILLSTRNQMFAVASDVPEKQVALVLGAQVYRSTTVSPILADRLRAAYNLYNAKKVTKIIVSGDHGTKYYNEVSAMRDYLLRAGVPAQDIFMDHAGFDTYDSVYRAKHIFEAKSVVIVTQTFHLSRALFIADALGLEAVGLSADFQEYSDLTNQRNSLREPLARLKAFSDVVFGIDPQVLGDKIPVTGDGRVTEDQ